MKRASANVGGEEKSEGEGGGGAPKRLREMAAARAEDSTLAVLAFAAKNHRRRFFIPSKQNSFGGIQYDHIMVDSGCSSCLFPFPLQNLGLGMVERFPSSRFRWGISQSVGTGAAHCPVLKIEGRLRARFDIVLNATPQPVSLSFMRFHLGSRSTTFVRDNFANMLQQSDIDILNAFLNDHENVVSERRHVLLGQSYCDSVFSAQVQDIIIFMDGTSWVDHASALPDLFIQCHDAARPMIDEYPEFHDLEDDDHDGDDQDEKDVRLSWDSEPEQIDELMT